MAPEPGQEYWPPPEHEGFLKFLEQNPKAAEALGRVTDVGNLRAYLEGDIGSFIGKSESENSLISKLQSDLEKPGTDKKAYLYNVYSQLIVIDKDTPPKGEYLDLVTEILEEHSTVSDYERAFRTVANFYDFVGQEMGKMGFKEETQKLGKARQGMRIFLGASQGIIRIVDSSSS